jgi:hypothetical protein
MEVKKLMCQSFMKSKKKKKCFGFTYSTDIDIHYIYSY